jgi:hypothetical protein
MLATFSTPGRRAGCQTFVGHPLVVFAQADFVMGAS